MPSHLTPQQAVADHIVDFYHLAQEVDFRAWRLLEALLDSQDRSLVGQTPRPDGTWLAVQASDDPAALHGSIARHIGVASLASEWDYHPQATRPLVRVSWAATGDDLTLRETHLLAREAERAHLLGDAGQVLKDLHTALARTLDSRLESDHRLTAGRHVLWGLAGHAQIAQRAMQQMTSLEPGLRPRVLATVMAEVIQLHGLAEEICNKGDSPTRNSQVASLEDALIQRLAGAGVVDVRIGLDPRGATLVLADRLPIVAWSARAVRDSLPLLRRQCAHRPAAAGRPGPQKATLGAAGAGAGAAPQPALQESNLADDVLLTLRSSVLEGDHLYLPAQLEKGLYARVNAAIELAGGKWNTRKKAHVLSGEGAREKFARMLATGSVLDPKDFDFFPTPAPVCAEIVALADIRPGMAVAEPSAGRGAIAGEMARIVGPENVHAFELLPENAQALWDLGLQVTEGDFLAQPAEPRFDRIVMNPPFGSQADMRHVEHALRMLKPGGRLVAIVSPAFEHRDTKQARAFRELLQAAGEVVKELPSGTFRESGTDVRTVVLRFEADRLPWLAEAEQVAARERAYA